MVRPDKMKILKKHIILRHPKGKTEKKSWVPDKQQIFTFD